MADVGGARTDDPGGSSLIHEVCTEFQRRYRLQDRPSLVEFLNRCRHENQPLAFTWLLAIEIRERKASGESPSPRTYEDLFPDYREEIQRVFGAAGLPPQPDETRSYRVDSVAVADRRVDDETRIAPQPNVAESPPEPDQPPQRPTAFGTDGPFERFLHYNVLCRLGHGGMGEVFLAEDTLLGRKVALKLMRADLGAVPLFKERFFREARAMAALDHPNVVPIYQIGEEQGVPFLCMPYLQGETLAQRLSRMKTLPEEAVLELIRQVAEGLAAAHAAGLVHRDIKPSNIWLVPDTADPEANSVKQVRILDFGLVRVEDGNPSMTGSQDILGTLNYLAPEQAARNRVDARSDLFSLGIVAYEAATGSHPFARSNAVLTVQAIVSAIPRSPRFLKPELSFQLSELVMQLLAKSADQRPESAQQLLKQIERLRVRNAMATHILPAEETKERRPRDESLSTGNKSAAGFSISPALVGVVVAVVAVVLMFGLILRELNSGGTWRRWTERNQASESLNSPTAAAAALPISNGEPPAAPAEGTSDSQASRDAPGAAGTDVATVNDASGIAPQRRLEARASIVVDDESYPSTDGSQNLITPVPEPIEDAQLADDGRLLVLRTRGQASLTIYDAAAGRLVRQLLLPTSEFLYAAGGDCVLVYLGEFQELERWNLKTFERDSVRDVRGLGIVTNLTMHSHNGDLALIRTTGSGSGRSSGVNLLDGRTLELVRKDGQPVVISSRNNSLNDRVHLRVSRDFGVITEWCSSHSPSGVGIMIRGADGEYQHFYDHESQWFLLPTDQGYIPTGGGKVYGTEMVLSLGSSAFDIPSLMSVDNTPLFPSTDGGFTVGIRPDGLIDVYQKGRSTPICQAGRFPSGDAEDQPPGPEVAVRRMQSESFIKSSFTFDRRVWPDPEAKHLLLIPESNDRIVRRAFDLQSLLEQTGKSFLVVTSRVPRNVAGGEKWTFTIEAVSDSRPVSFRVVEGPESMSIDAEGTLTWTAPAGIVGRVPVSIRLENSSGQQTLFRFILELGSDSSRAQRAPEVLDRISQAVESGIDFLRHMEPAPPAATQAP